MSRGPKRKTNDQHFTPDDICRLLVALSGPPKPSGFTHIGDPACGSGAMMLAYDYTYNHTKYPDVIYHHCKTSIFAVSIWPTFMLFYLSFRPLSRMATRLQMRYMPSGTHQDISS